MGGEGRDGGGKMGGGEERGTAVRSLLALQRSKVTYLTQ